MDFQSKLRNFLGSVKQGASNFIQGAAQQAAPIAQQAANYGSQLMQRLPELPQQITAGRQLIEQNISPVLSNFAQNTVKSIPAPALQQLLPVVPTNITRNVLSQGASGLADLPASYARGAEFITNPARRAEVGNMDLMGKLQAGGDVMNFVPTGHILKGAGKLAGAVDLAQEGLGQFGKIKLGPQISRISKELEPLAVVAKKSKNYEEFLSKVQDTFPITPQVLDEVSSEFKGLKNFYAQSAGRKILAQKEGQLSKSFQGLTKEEQLLPAQEASGFKSTGQILEGQNPKSIVNKAQPDGFKRLENLLTYDDTLKRAGVPTEQRAKMDVHTGSDYINKMADSGYKPKELSESVKASNRFMADVADEARAAKDPFQTSQTLDDAIMTSDVKKKVNIVDYLRTPENVMNKMGMGKQAQELRQSYDNYLDELPKEIDRITTWSKSVSPEANQRIFKWLDGQNVPLVDNEIKVAGQIKQYLAGWADRLGLPQERRVSNYITHLFDRELVTKEFDPELAKLIRDKVAGSVYDPFTMERLGKRGYVEDTWQALDAYVKRATRKANLDPTLRKISEMSNNLEDSQFNYVKSYIDRINMRPTQVDNLIDNAIKSTPFGYKLGQRPLTVGTQMARKAIYRGLIGLNPGTALKNLSQGANTYAKLGEKHTIIGYAKVAQNMAKFLSGAETELEKVGILRDGFIEDRTINATKKNWERIDKGLFYMFNVAEKINRGAAYWGAKSKGLSKGMTEAQAIEYAKKIVRDTQFTFGSVDTPVALSSDLAKTFGQFQSFTVKQGEFFAGMMKNKEYAGMLRWAAASLGFVYSVGKLIGMEPKDLIPSFRMGVPPTLQAPMGAVEVLTSAKDKYGNPPDPRLLNRALENKNLTQGTINYFPAGGQISKGIKGFNDASSGFATNDNGSVKFPIERSTTNKVRGALFGTNNLDEAQDYYDEGLKPLLKTQNDVFRGLPYGEKEDYYNSIQDARRTTKEEKMDASLVSDDDLLKSADASEATPVSYNAVKAKLAKKKETAEQTEEWDKIKASGVPLVTSKEVKYVDDKGKKKTIEVDRKIDEPQLTGQSELDKERLTAFSAQITSKINDIEALYKIGQLTAPQAEAKIVALKELQKNVKAKTTKSAAKKKGKAIKGVSFMKAAGVKLSQRKTIKINLPKFNQSLAKAPTVRAKRLAFKLGK